MTDIHRESYMHLLADRNAMADDLARARMQAGCLATLAWFQAAAFVAVLLWAISR